MLRQLARWRGRSIAMLWVALIVVEVGVALAVRVPAGPGYASDLTSFSDDAQVKRITEPRRESLPPDLQVLRAAGEDPEPRGSFRELVDSIFVPVWQSLSDTVLSPQFFLLLAAIALFFYGLPLALLVLTVLWLIARRRYGPLPALPE